ncbi:MAG: hypothetical protein J6P54_10145, partial [Bacteroidales bacterium]|nr:hypothetical protein [Bacteroidales bacterium]
VLWVQSVRGETLLQGLLAADEHRLGHIGVVAAVEDMVGRGDGEERVEDVIGGRAGQVVVELRQVGIVSTEVWMPALSIKAMCFSTSQPGMGNPSSISAPLTLM